MAPRTKTTITAAPESDSTDEQASTDAQAPSLIASLTAASRASAVAGHAAENAAIEQVLFAAFQLKQRAQQVLHDISEETAADIQAVIDKL